MLTRSLVTGAVAVVGFLVLVATTELFYFGPPDGAHNGGEAFASFGGAALTFLTWAVVGWSVARTARALRLRRVSVLVGILVPAAAIVSFALTIELDGWATGFGVLSFAAAAAGVLVTTRRSSRVPQGVAHGSNGPPPVHMAA